MRSRHEGHDRGDGADLGQANPGQGPPAWTPSIGYLHNRTLGEPASAAWRPADPALGVDLERAPTAPSQRSRAVIITRARAAGPAPSAWPGQTKWLHSDFSEWSHSV